jgi:Tfp pilus assembly major pilin PilA
MELLIVLAILVVLAALLFPVYGNAKRAAQVSVTMSRLAQCQLAISLYRADHEPDSATMGLPSMETVLNARNLKGSFYGATDEQWRSGCGQHRTGETPYFYMFFDSLDYMLKAGEDAILLVDEQCNDGSVDLRAEYMTRRAIAVRLNGTIVQRQRRGSAGRPMFWE